MVEHRGKLHNPVTNSGGILTGIVRRAGLAFPSPPAPGTAYLFETGIWAELLADIPEPASLAAFDVAGAPARVRLRTRPGSRVLVIGAGHSGALSAVAAAEAGAADVLVADVDPTRLAQLRELELPKIRPLHADAQDAVAFAGLVGAPVDLAVSCVNIPGIETACILSTRRDGFTPGAAQVSARSRREAWYRPGTGTHAAQRW